VLDEQNQRLFVGVAWQHRVLAFDVHPERLQQTGQAASFVIGQEDFTSAESGLSASRFRQTDGLSYDDVNHRLYVTDKYNHRVLVYDVPPGRAGNLPEAMAAIGEQGFNSIGMGPGDPRNFQDRLHDPRGSAFDSADQRLFQSEGLNGRLTVFTMPREEYRVDLPGRSQLKYESLDAQMSTGPTPFMLGYSELELNEATSVAAISSHLVTQAVMDPDSERQSRVLVSEAALPVPEPRESHLYFFDNSATSHLSLAIVNGNASRVDVDFVLIATNDERHETSRRLDPGQQMNFDARELFPELDERRGALSITAERAVSIAGVLHIDESDGRMLLVPAPQAIESENELMAERRVLPAVTTGAGQRVTYVLLNSTDQPMTGTLDVDGQTITYSIVPGGAFVNESGEDTRPLATGSGIIRAAEGPAPTAYALSMTERRDRSLASAHIVPSHQEGTLFWGPVDTYPSLLRHGDIEMTLDLANEGPVPATVYLELFDTDGVSSGRVEQIVPLGRRDELSLEDAFGRSPIRGTLRVFSDAPIVAALRRTVENVIGERIVTDIPLQPNPESAIDSLIFPLFADGSGIATEMLMMNSGRTDRTGSLRVRGEAGEVLTMILR
jgi:hypothetical protein